MSRRCFRVAAYACLLAAGLVAADAPSASEAAVLRAMQAELKRSVAGLKQPGAPPTYFLGYLVTETDDTSLSASRGALQHESSNRSRLLDVEVRVGDYELDNTRQLRDDRSFERFDRGQAVLLPLDDDVDALRGAIWLETDRKYKTALERLIKVKANVAVKVQQEDAAADFSHEAPQQYAGLPARLVVDSAAWRAKLKEYSALFNARPEILESSVSLSSGTTTKWFVSSEGTTLTHGTTHARLSVYATVKAEDGMNLYRFESFDSSTLAGLPDDAKVRSAIERIASDLRTLREAPVVEPYTGPAILSGRAAGVFFHEIFGHRIEGHRQKNEEEGQTFTKKVNQPVLPAFLSVYDDPTSEKADAIDLNGHYAYDDEGVKAQRVPVVERGVLKSFLMSRSPIAGFPRSNGHGRKQPGLRAVGRQGNLIVEAHEAVPEVELRRLLKEECKKQGKPFGLLFKDISGGFTFTGRGIPQAFQVTPIMVYRVYTDARPDELVRGADLIGTPLVSFSRILAAGDKREVFNGHCGAESGWVPVSAVSPSILTAQIEIQKKEKSSDRPPLLPAPGRSTP